MASTKDWFESIAEAERRAERRLARSVYGALIAGAEGGVTVGDNEAAFRELGVFPRIARGLSGPRTLATSVLGQPISMPVLISPTGVEAVNPDGEVAVARATAGVRTAMGLSSFASKPIAAVVAANPQTFFQVCWLGSRERILQILQLARDAGAKGIILTLDWTFVHRRDWGSPAISDKLDLKTMATLAPEVVFKSRWPCDFARPGGPADPTAPNMAAPGGAPRASSAPTASGCKRHRPRWRTSPGCAANGKARS